MRAIAILLLLACRAWAFPPTKAVPLETKGDTITVVRSFPVTITAPAGADFYLWSYPDGFKAEAADNALTITAAPQGTHKIKVMSVSVVIDFEKKTKTVNKDTGETEIVVGTPKVPDPPTPPPPAGLAKALKDACAASPGTAAEKADHMGKLASLYRKAPDILDKLTTSGQLQTALIEARRLLPVPDTALLPVRKVIADELAKVLPADPAAPYGDPPRVKALFSTIEAALVEAVK